jgi:uncharacterized protein
VPLDPDQLKAQLERDGVVNFEVKAVPRASVSAVTGIMDDGSLRVKVAAVPDKGKANEELRTVLANHFGVSRRNVEIVAGQASQHKRVRIFL